MTFEFHIDLPPSTNALFTNRKGTKYRIKTNEYRVWSEKAIYSIRGQIHRQTCLGEIPTFPKRTRWKYLFSFYFKDWRSDASNFIKPTEDAICEAFRKTIDDRYVTRGHFTKTVGKRSGVHVIMRIGE